MFSLSFHRNTDINKIFNIKTICRAAVTLESIRSNKHSVKYANHLVIHETIVIKHQNMSNALDHTQH
jgi:hypothetical protein